MVGKNLIVTGFTVVMVHAKISPYYNVCIVSMESK